MSWKVAIALLVFANLILGSAFYVIKYGTNKRAPSTQQIEAARKFKEETEAEFSELKAKNYRWPKQHEIYQLKQDTELPYITHYNAPFSGGGKAIIPKGSTLELMVVPEVGETLVYYAVLTNEKEMEKVIVPEKEWQSPKYSGYSLFVSVRELNEKFQLVSSVAK